MDLSDVIQVTISRQSAQVTRAGFGVPLILDYHTKNNDRIRYYTDLAGMVSDGFSASDAAYKAAAALISQSPRPPRFAIGRRALAPTQSWTLVPIAKNTQLYRVVVDGQNADYTSDGSATLAEITAGIKAAIDALSLAVTVTTPSNTSVHIVANAAGAWHQVAVPDTLADILSNAQDQADPGCTTDLDAIALVDSTWYALLCTTASAAEIAAIAGWAESHLKLYLVSSQDSAIITVADTTPATDIAHVLKAAARTRSPGAYHPDNAAFLAACWAGRCLPLDPGSETWKFKQLSGPAAVNLTATHIANLRAKKFNFYTTLGGLNVMEDGIVPSGEFIDVIRGLDWLVARIQEAVYTRLANANKVPFTDKGIGIIAADIYGVLKLGVDQQLLAGDPKPTVGVPKAADVSPSDKAARSLTGVTFTATLAGAVHSVTINGTVLV